MLKKYINQLVAGSICLVISATVIASVLLIRGATFNIRSSDVAKTSSGEIINSIAVKGDGKVFATPDIAYLSVSVSKTALKTTDASNIVNTGILHVKEIAKAKGVQDIDIQTTSYSIYPEYDYSSYTRKLTGQRVTHTLQVKIRGVNTSTTNLNNIIDQVSSIDGLQIQNINFDIQDKTAFYAQARELAYKKAEQKANQLATLSGLSLQKPVSISDSTTNYSYVQANTYLAEKSSGSSSSSDISVGQYEVSVSLDVTFGVM